MTSYLSIIVLLSGLRGFLLLVDKALKVAAGEFVVCLGALGGLSKAWMIFLQVSNETNLVVPGK